MNEEKGKKPVLLNPPKPPAKEEKSGEDKKGGEGSKPTLLNPPKLPVKKEKGEESSKPTLLNPPKPPTKEEMTPMELHIAGKKKAPKWLIVLLLVLTIIVVSGLAFFLLRGRAQGISPRADVAQEQKGIKDDDGNELIPSGSVANGKMTATITDTPTIQDGTVSFTVEWGNNSSDSTYTPSDFTVSQNGTQLQAKAGYYSEEVLPGQKREVRYTYNLFNNNDDVKIIIGSVAEAGAGERSDSSSSAAKLVGTVIKVRGE
jgi:hypothetical protein